MALFKRKKNESVMPAEVRDYYKSERRERKGMAWLLAVATLLVTFLIAAALFFGGRWVYRAIFDNDDKTSTSQTTTEQGTSESDQSSNSTSDTDTSTSTSGGVTSSTNTSNTGTTTTPSTSSTGTTTQTVPSTGPSELINTGPGDE